MKSVSVGCATGYLEDRLDPALALIRSGVARYVVFETLNEATMTVMQQARAEDEEAGYARLAVERMREVLPLATAHDVRIISSLGAANPAAAGRHVARIADELGLDLRIAVVEGDDVLAQVRGEPTLDLLRNLDTGAPVTDVLDQLIAANVYLGAEPIVEALALDADVVITGRVTDTAMYLAPLVHELGWAWDDLDRLAQGVMVGHVLECAGHVTGGNYQGPGWRAIDYSRLGHAYAEVTEDGDAVIGLTPGTSGIVTSGTVSEQLLYEIHDPSRFLTPDVVVDLSGVELDDLGDDRVRLRGIVGRPRTDSLKLVLGYRDGFLAEGQVIYPWPDAVEKAELAARTVETRLKRLHDFSPREWATQIIGAGGDFGLVDRDSDPFEVKLRVAAKVDSEEEAAPLLLEMSSFYDGGPAAAAGILGVTSASKSLLRPLIGVWPALYPRDRVEVDVSLVS